MAVSKPEQPAKGNSSKRNAANHRVLMHAPSVMRSAKDVAHQSTKKKTKATDSTTPVLWRKLEIAGADASEIVPILAGVAFVVRGSFHRCAAPCVQACLVNVLHGTFAFARAEELAVAAVAQADPTCGPIRGNAFHLMIYKSPTMDSLRLDYADTGQDS